MLGVQIFQLYGNLFTDEAHQPWEKIVKVQTDTIPREDLRGEVHEKKAGKPGPPLGLHDIPPPVCIPPCCS